MTERCCTYLPVLNEFCELDEALTRPRHFLVHSPRVKLKLFHLQKQQKKSYISHFPFSHESCFLDVFVHFTNWCFAPASLLTHLSSRL